MIRGNEEGCFGSANGGGNSSQSARSRQKQGPGWRNGREYVGEGVGIGSAATKQTDEILGYSSDDLADIMKDIAAEYGLSHIAYLCLAASKTDSEFAYRCDDVFQGMAGALLLEAVHYD